MILLPWAVWGKLFGWSLTSPVYANIVFNMIALGAFCLLVRPDKKQSAFVLGLLGVFIPYTRYMLSGMPEALFMCLGIWFVALSLSYDKDKRLWKLFALTASFSSRCPDPIWDCFSSCLSGLRFGGAAYGAVLAWLPQ